MIIPLRDINPRLTTPIVNVALIAANVLVFLYQASLPARLEHQLIFTLGMVPARVQLALTSSNVTLQQALFPLFTSMFLHGGWLHLIGNMWFLWVFGDNIEDRFGHLKYLLFYLGTGIGAGVIHTIVNWGSPVPSVGASGAISGVLGAYFVLFPGARVRTLVCLIFIFTLDLPAALILGWWFLLQFLSGMSSLGARTTGGTAWWAHIGGFVLGFVLAKVVSPARRADYRIL